MTLLIRPPTETESELTRGPIVLPDVDWDLYEHMLRATGESSTVRITFDQGRLELMSPSNEHEQYGVLIGRLIEIIGFVREIPIAGFGSTTLRRKDLARGLEADECYYIQNEPRIRKLKRLDFKKDPPPDLVVEIDITHHALNREEIYAALGIPELWRFDGEHLTALHLRARGGYVEQPRSRAFPFLAMRELERFVKMQWRIDQTTIVRRFAEWLKEGTEPSR